MTTKLDLLDGRVAVVTGGSTMVGQGVVEALVSAGARVVVADIDEAGGAELTARFPDAVEFHTVDITDDARVTELFDDVVAKHGGLDVLVNLAALYQDNGPDSTREDWMRTLGVNVVSTAIVSQIARPHLAKSQHAAIVNFTSISSSVAQTGRWTYPTSKAALLNLTKSMAMDYAPDGIRVNSVSPGWTWSNVMKSLSQDDRAHTDSVAAPFHLTGRVGDPIEVGWVVVFLCSDLASVVTGADYKADGGYSAMGPEQAVPAIPNLERD